MTKKERIRKHIIKNWENLNNENVEEPSTIESITNDLENEELINFSINEFMFPADGERWLQCEYMSKIGKAIIFNYNVAIYWETINEFIDALINCHKEIEQFENKIIFNN